MGTKILIIVVAIFSVGFLIGSKAEQSITRTPKYLHLVDLPYRIGEKELPEVIEVYQSGDTIVVRTPNNATGVTTHITKRIQ